MKRIIYGLLALILLGSQSCSPTRFIEPLEKGEFSVGGSFGGPVIDYNAPIPMPLSSVEVGYGLDTNLTVFGGLHTTAILFGDLQVDLGTSYQIMQQNGFKPNLSLSPSINFVYSFEYRSAKLWPIIDANAFWNYGERKNYFYVGVNNYFELSSTMANNQPQAHHWLFNPQLGHVLKGKDQNWQLTTELKFLAPYLDNSTEFIPYKSLTGNYGATGFFVGCRWIIGKRKIK